MPKKTRKGIIVAIDGPAGAGKSTVSQKLALALKGRLLDTGAMYRAVAYYAIQTETEAARELGKIARSLKFSMDKRGKKFLVNGKNLGLKLRSEAVSKMASAVSRFPEVRRVLTKKQRELAKLWSQKMPVVVEGRDVGTVVFPKVPYKFFVTADARVRAKRRYEQLKAQKQLNVNFYQILHEQRARDRQDSTRTHAPLRCAADAITVDTSQMTLDQVVAFIVQKVLE